MPRETGGSRAETRRKLGASLQELVGSMRDSYGILESDTVPWAMSPLIAITYGDTDMALQLHSNQPVGLRCLGRCRCEKNGMPA